MTDLYWDPFTPELRDDPYPLWKRLRDEAPAWYNERLDFWAITRFHDIEVAFKDWETYGSAHGTTLEGMSEQPSSEGGLIISLDPPRHTMLRKLVSRSFTGRRLAVMEATIRSVCADLLDPHMGSAGFDYVQEFSAILPPTIIASMLGVPEADKERLRPVVDDVFHIEEGVGTANAVAHTALFTLRQYLREQFVERRTTPRDDMMTDLVNEQITDESGVVRGLTDDELADFGLLLFAAGSETVARHLGWVAALLDEFPDQRAELAGDLSLVPNAIEEILRMEAPSPVNARWVNHDVELHGSSIPAGSRVILVNGSANRDERRYADPNALDIHRKVELHLTFGYGIHFCLGAALARLEGRIGLEETLKRWPTWEVDRDRAELLYTSTVRGPHKLPINV